MELKIMTTEGEKVIKAESCELYAIHRTWCGDKKSDDWAVTFVPNGYSVAKGFPTRQIARAFVKEFKKFHVEKTRLVDPSIRPADFTEEEMQLRRKCIDLINHFKTGHK
ncbi:MAG: hypothetical protein ABFC98_03125 [Candidatus Cloacimonas sp.]